MWEENSSLPVNVSAKTNMAVQNQSSPASSGLYNTTMDVGIQNTVIPPSNGSTLESLNTSVQTDGQPVWTSTIYVSGKWTVDNETATSSTLSTAPSTSTSTFISQAAEALSNLTSSSWSDPSLTTTSASVTTSTEGSMSSTIRSWTLSTTLGSNATLASNATGSLEGVVTGPANLTERPLLTVEEGEAEAPEGSDVKELVYVIIVIAFYSAALLALVILQIRRYYTRHSSYTSFGGDPAETMDGYDLYEEYSEHRQLIFQESRRADNERKVRRIQGVQNGYNIDAIPEHVV